MARLLITEYGNLSDGFGVVFQYVQYATEGFFIPVLLFSICIILTFANYRSDMERFGRGDFFKSLTFGAFITFIVATLLKLITGLVNPVVFGLCVGLLVFSFMGLVFSKR